MRFFLHLLGLLLWLYLLCLTLRLVISWIQAFARNWRPKGVALVIAEAVYTVTDPPVKLAERLIPPLRFGGIGLNLGFMLVFILVMMGATLLSRV